jgi:hypothetical protein
LGFGDGAQIREASWSAVAERERRHRFRAEDELWDFHAVRACESGVALRSRRSPRHSHAKCDECPDRLGHSDNSPALTTKSFDLTAHYAITSDLMARFGIVFGLEQRIINASVDRNPKP